MRLEDLLPLNNAEALAKLTDAELEQRLQVLFPLTRPEFANKEKNKTAPPVAKQLKLEEMDKLSRIEKGKAIARKMGIEI